MKVHELFIFVFYYVHIASFFSLFFNKVVVAIW